MRVDTAFRCRTSVTVIATVLTPPMSDTAATSHPHLLLLQLLPPLHQVTVIPSFLAAVTLNYLNYNMASVCIFVLVL